MLLGTYEPKLDDKGRIILPAKFRDEFAGGLVLTRGQERCVYVFPRPTFDALLDTVQSAPLTSKAARDYVRLLLSGGSDEIPDKQGRVMIPTPLREYAGLEREVVVVGNGTTLEIWNSESWTRYLASQEDNFSDLSEEVIPGIL